MKADRRQFLRQSALSALVVGQAWPPGSRTMYLPEFESPSVHGVESGSLRQEFLLQEGLTYLNTGSLGPCPRAVLNRMTTALTELEGNPVGYNWGHLGEQMEQVRDLAAHFLGTKRDHIVLTRNTTEGINLVGSCLAINPGDEILTTDQEHAGGENGLLYLAEQKGAIIKKMTLPLGECTSEAILQLISSSLTSRTKVLMLSHINTISGLRMPLKEISALTRPLNILFMVDGAQAPGMIRVDVETSGADIYATSGHKWLLGPKETGLLYLHPGVQERIKPAFLRSGYAAYSASGGTRNVGVWIGLGAALQWHQNLGIDHVENRCFTLARYCRQKLADVPGLIIISPSHPELATGMVSVQLINSKNQDVFEALRQRKIIVKLLPQFNALRFSTHVFNTETDVDLLVKNLIEIGLK